MPNESIWYNFKRWVVGRIEQTDGSLLWIASAPENNPLDDRKFNTWAEAFAYALEQASK